LGLVVSTTIKELAIATEKVEQEDYSVRVIPRTKDEIGLLAYSFNKMVQGLEERERMKDAFGRFVNKEIAEKALRGEIKLGGEKKECTIFFSDLRGFTAMSEKMKPEEVVEYLNRYFTIMVDCVEKTHGIVDKFIGDAIMATWGTVSGYGNHTENAINGALLMRKALIEFNQYNKEHNLPIAKMGCGINTGEVISGQIGSEKRLEFTVIGDAVNLASRIESLNKPFATDILISQDTYDRVKDIFDVVKMPAIKVKGKSEPQTIYCVLGRKDDPNRPKTLDELRKLVGIDWKPQIKEGQETLGEDQDEEKKYEILQ
jgi:adenylate cyclase